MGGGDRRQVGGRGWSLKVDKSRQLCVYYSHTMPLNQSLGYHWVSF